MCTAICRGALCGRTLDYEFSYSEEVVITPRKMPLPLTHLAPLSEHYALIGMAFLQKGFPLYYDAMNEKGLWGAGLAFEGNAHYFPPRTDALNLASFELIPYLLGRCGSLSELEALLQSLNITDHPFSPSLPPSPLHWIFADKAGALVLESTKEGLKIYPDPIGVLTNNPPFPYHMARISEFSHLSRKAPAEPLFPFAPPFSRGFGGIGLPGDLSSSSRFVRAAFTNALAAKGETDAERVRQGFRVLGAVAQVKGCVALENGELEHTIYTACADLKSGIYYYSTHRQSRILGVSLFEEDLDGAAPLRFPLLKEETIPLQNALAKRGTADI